MKRKKKPTNKRKLKAIPITEERVRQIIREETNKGTRLEDFEVIIKDKNTGKIIANKGLVQNITIKSLPYGDRLINLDAVFNNLDM